MKEIPLDKLLPQGHQDMLNAYHEYMAQASDIGYQIIESDMKTNKEKKKCKSCVYCGKVAGLLQCDIFARSRVEMNPLNPSCSKYKKRKK